MKFSANSVFKIAGSTALALLLVSCGDDKASPKAVDIEELKFASDLRIIDNGDGSATLTWRGMNNEDDFSGYNLYGAKDDDTKNLVAREGETVQLLSDTGDPLTAGREFLAKLSYNGTDWETVATTENKDEDADFQFFPYYAEKNEDGEAILPSCRPTAAGTCAAVTAATEDATSQKLNGETTFTVTGLKPGSRYCFTVLSTLDEGSEVAQTTSEVRCLVPRYKVETSASINRVATGASAARNQQFDLEATRLACVEGNCGTIAGAQVDTTTTEFCAAGNTTKAFCLEVNSDGAINITAGKNSAVQDLGYYENGLADTELPDAPALSTYTGNDLQNKDGYSLSFQSLPLEEGRVYVVAQGTADSPTSFYYHWIYITRVTKADTGNAVTGTVTWEFRISNQADERKGNKTN